MLPSADILNEFEQGKFVLSNLAAKRAKQLREGALPLVRIDSNHPLTIALAEIAAGKIKPMVPAAAELIDDAIEVPVLSDGSIPVELGLLLPSLDEVELISEPEEEEPDDADDDDEPRAVSLTDLADDSDDVDDDEVGSADSEDDTLSLTDIAEQEESDSDEESPDQ